jgi:AraC-like DNA-binding protein
MHLTFISPSSAEKKMELPYPMDFAGPGYFEERKTELIEAWGKFKAKELWFDGACLIQSEAILKDTCTVNIMCNSFCWMMNFVQTGELTAQLAPIKTIILSEGSHHTFYTTALNADLVLKRSVKMFTVCLTRKFISKLIGNDGIKLPINESATLITTGNYKHTQLQAILKEITDAVQPGYIRRIFLESKILELLAILLHHAETKTATKGFNKDDVARLQEAKQIIAQNLQTPCSLIELARKTGLNDFKLKKGFKALFGNTVFGYLFELRMDNAYSLLQNGKSVSEVAEVIGYKNPHHFTAAFKKKFGFLPSQVAKMAG